MLQTLLKIGEWQSREKKLSASILFNDKKGKENENIKIR